MSAAALVLFAAATSAKLAQYEPKDSSTKYLAQAVKMRDTQIDPVDHVFTGPSVTVALPAPAASEGFAPVLDAPPALQIVVLPFHSRPPPLTFPRPRT